MKTRDEERVLAFNNKKKNSSRVSYQRSNPPTNIFHCSPAFSQHCFWRTKIKFPPYCSCLILNTISWLLPLENIEYSVSVIHVLLSQTFLCFLKTIFFVSFSTVQFRCTRTYYYNSREMMVTSLKRALLNRGVLLSTGFVTLHLREQRCRAKRTLHTLDNRSLSYQAFEL